MEIDWIAIGGAAGGIGFGLYGAFKAWRASKKADKAEKKVETYAADGGGELRTDVDTALAGQIELRTMMNAALESMRSSLNEAQQEREYLNAELNKVRSELATTKTDSIEAKHKAEALQVRVIELEHALVIANNTITTLTRQNEGQQIELLKLKRRLETGEFRTNTPAERKAQNDAE